MIAVAQRYPARVANAPARNAHRAPNVGQGTMRKKKPRPAPAALLADSARDVVGEGGR